MVNRSVPPEGQDGTTDAYREFRLPLTALALAIVTAGALDAFAFLRYGAFVANQSGNVIFLGMGPAGEHPEWPVSGAAIVAFAVSAGLVDLLRRSLRPPMASMVALAVTAAVMVVWTVLDLALAHGRYGMASRVLLAAAGAVAMGSLTTVATRATGVPTPITYQSGTTKHTGEQAVRWFLGPRAGRVEARHAALLGLFALGCYTTGGALGTLAQHQSRWVPPSGTVAMLVLMLLVRRRLGGSAGASPPDAAGR
ncbi:YoaK family protein [Micromonospora sp. CP22]|uniref:YoaK family protein n=1 Tax=Micromonospora sp. CP22 TaxID=2580517 RepID=UPI0012BCEB3C|nr:YoaK family protein [Micromonospora sp. CP22]